jgi:segregation and condensation protein A
MTSSFAQTAIALLIDMAERGDIDPWDVEVVTVFDRCLNELAQRNQQDLSHSGQVFLYASMLVLLKSDSLIDLELNDSDSDLEPLDDFGLDADASLNLPLPLHLERRLQRRSAAPAPQRRRVTLQELITHLEVIAATVEPAHRTRSHTVQRQTKSAAIKSITQLAHQENLVEIAAEVEQFLHREWPFLSAQQEWLDLETLLQFKNDRVGVFWALLFLASQSKVELYQEEFYQELKLRPYALEELATGA